MGEVYQFPTPLTPERRAQIEAKLAELASRIVGTENAIQMYQERIDEDREQMAQLKKELRRGER